MSQSLAEVAVLGVLQGLTEFLPVSSSGHLALSGQLMGLGEAGLTLNVMLHAGTLVATMVVLRRPLWQATKEGALALRRPSRLRQTPGGRDGLFVLIASMPTALVGLLLKSAVERWTESALVVGMGFLATSALLLSVRWVRGGKHDVPTVLGALLVGLAQGIAVIPGLSRSGSTICVAMWLGVRPGRAFELSMLTSIPAVLGAVLVELPDMPRVGSGGMLGVGGAVVAFAVGVVALLALRGVVDRGRLSWFVLWTLPLGLVAFGLAAAF